MVIESVDPTTGVVWQAHMLHSSAEVDERLGLAATTYASYRRTTFLERSQWMLTVADLLETQVDLLAALASREMGKTLASARAEVLKCVRGCRYYADKAQGFLAEETADASAVGATRARVLWEPIGAILGIMPWNYPYWQVIRFVVPTLMAGNVAILKHASNVTGCALALERIFRDAGLPPGAFQALLIDTDSVSAVVADPRVAAVTLTGSESAGRAVGASAGAALKKVVLELGGSDPFVVLPSADINRAAHAAARSRFDNAGQSCIAAKRFLVHRECLEAFLETFVSQVAGLRVGDPSESGTDVGPLATPRAAAELQGLVDDAVAHGAEIVHRHVEVPRAGWFFPPTVLSNVTPAMRLYREEAFGPVAAVIPVSSVDDAIRIANDTPFGLGANVWTANADEQSLAIGQIEAGAVFVNGITASHPELPFGGIKASGYGRELAALGIREFCNAKTIWEA